jgi:hypothetical protein
MTELSTTIPAEIRAGDTAKWQRSGGDYPASAGWALVYTLVGSAGAFNFPGAASGADFTVTVSATITATWPAGVYAITESVSKSGERYTLSSKSIRVLENLVGAIAGDKRSHAQKMLDSIEAWLESKAPTAALVEIAGRKIQNYALSDLLALRDKYKFEVAKELRLASGSGIGKLLVRF